MTEPLFGGAPRGGACEIERWQLVVVGAWHCGGAGTARIDAAFEGETTQMVSEESRSAYTVSRSLSSACLVWVLLK